MKHATSCLKQSPKATPVSRNPVSRKPVVNGSRSTTKTKMVSSTKPTAKPSQRENITPATESTRKPTPSDNSRPDWISGGLGQITDAFSTLAEQKIKDTLAPSNPVPTPDAYPDYDYLTYEGVDGSGLSQGDGEGSWEHTESFASRTPPHRNHIQPPPPDATPRIFHKSERVSTTKMPQSRPGRPTPGTRKCGQKVGCSEWGEFKEDTLMPFIQLLTNSNGQGLDMFPDDDSGSQLFSKEGLESFSKGLDSHSPQAPLELNTGIMNASQILLSNARPNEDGQN